MNRIDKKFIEYYKLIIKAKEIIELGNLSVKDISKVNNLYSKAEKLLLEINNMVKPQSYSTVEIVGGVLGVTALFAALIGGYLYYGGNIQKYKKQE